MSAQQPPRQGGDGGSKTQPRVGELEETVKRRAPVNIKDLIKDLGDPGTPDKQAIQDFTDACRQADEDPRERQRYRDIADLIEAEDALYAQAVAALDRGDHGTALPLLRLAAERGIGEAAWLLAVTLDERGETDEAIRWYERADLDGDPRAAAALGTRQAPCVPVARRYMLDLDLLTHFRDGATGSPGDALRSGLWSPKTIVVVADYDRIGTAAHDQDADCRAASLRHATWPFPAVMHLSCHGERPQAVRELCPESLGIATDPAMAVRVFTELASTRNAIAHGRVADVAGVLGERLAYCDRESRAKLLLDRFLWEGVDPAFRAEVLAGLTDDRGYAPPGSGVVPWPGRRRASRTAAGHVMISYAAMPVLAPGMTVDAALGQILQSGESALPVSEGSVVAGVVTLADLARTVHGSRGVPSIQRVEALMRAPAEVTIDTPLPEVRAAMSRDDAGLVVVRGPGGGVVGYITASSLLTVVC